MSEPNPDRDEIMLARLAELDLALAEKPHAAAMAAEDPKDTADLARAYQRIARSLRQSLALKAKLHRDLACDARENPAPAPPPPLRDDARVLARADEVRIAVQRIVFDEKEGEEADYLYGALEDRLHALAHEDRLGHKSLDDDIAAVCIDFGLTARGFAAWPDLPDPVFAEASEDEDDEDEDEDGRPTVLPRPRAGWRSSG